MVKFLEYSDVHNEFGLFEIPTQPNEKELGLVIAGDFAVPSNHSHFSIPLLRLYSERFAWIIYILGNHEYYKGAIPRTFDKICQGVADCRNVHVMENQSILIDDVLFICATLWSDFDNGNPLSMYNIDQGMNDFQLIRYGTVEDQFWRRFKTIDAFKLHKQSKEFIFKTISQAKISPVPPRKIVVVTHHAPSFQSIPSGFYNNMLNGGYASELGYAILENCPDYWFHGHIHDSVDYMIGDCHVLSNPRGYAGYMENPNFNPNFTITI